MTDNHPTETSARVAGHELTREGAPHNARGGLISSGFGYSGVGGRGRAKCSCGTLSAVLESGGQRKKWQPAGDARPDTTGGNR